MDFFGGGGAMLPEMYQSTRRLLLVRRCRLDARSTVVARPGMAEAFRAHLIADDIGDGRIVGVHVLPFNPWSMASQPASSSVVLTCARRRRGAVLGTLPTAEHHYGCGQCRPRTLRETCLQKIRKLRFRGERNSAIV
ncbi:hypothetical protein OsI_07067 [Oryza sativa Indica Group]|jgi:hypothetical protein|uniref:Uncharacterized protein n=1 Tax=Oryza sativa subsp. indica TaxID=39946 RepID=A2X4D8_ORYSI|nr:hypothetical protein OsI_07067 [Oryza sativa Indica Group]